MSVDFGTQQYILNSLLKILFVDEPTPYPLVYIQTTKTTDDSLLQYLAQKGIEVYSINDLYPSTSSVDHIG